MPGPKTLAKGFLDQFSLGKLAVEDGVISPDELSELLSEFRYRQKGILFGQFLVEKGVLTNEKLQLLLIRQSAARGGGVEKRHVVQAMDLANKTSRRMMRELDGFLRDVHALSVRVGEIK